MHAWNEGYVSEVAYTHGYYHELNPLRIKLAFALAGLVAPEVKTAVELGFGQGMSVLLHGAGSQVEWHGNDFNPAQTGFANELASEAQVPVHLTDEAFAEFCARTDLPDFDYVGLHGIWSWVNEANRQIIVDFLKRKVKVGGVVYASYNAMPGWGFSHPLRQILSQHDARLGAPGQPVVERVAEAMDFLKRVLDTDPAFSRVAPAVHERYKMFAEQNRQYLAHEFFNQNWHVQYFSEMAERLAPAKLEFACSASLAEGVDSLHLTPAQRELLNTVDDPILRETVRDCMTNTNFRKDYWVKGLRRVSEHEHGGIVRSTPVVLTMPRDDVPMKIKGGLGEADLQPDIYSPILDVLADQMPHTIGAIKDALPNISFANVLQAMMIFAGLGALTVATYPTDEARMSALRMNLAICQRARMRTDLGHLASPVTGGGISVTRFQMLFLLARAEGMASTREWAEAVWNVLVSQNQRLLQDGKPIESDAGNVALLVELAENFASKRLPMLEALGVT